MYFVVYCATICMVNKTFSFLLSLVIPRPIAGALSDDVRLTSVCLSRTSGLSREQRGLGRLKLAQRYPTSHVTRTPLQRSTCRGRGHIVASSRKACCGMVTFGRKRSSGGSVVKAEFFHPANLGSVPAVTHISK